MPPCSPSLRCLLLAALASIQALSQTPPSSEAGGLLVAPTRVVFENRKRSAELNLSNIGGTKATFRISLIRMEMDEAGGFKELSVVPVAGQIAPESLIRFSPREVTLDPQESQTLRLQIRKPADLPPGEYRVHMLFRAVPSAEEPSPEGEKTQPPKGISIRLTPVYGLSIPLIIRHGDTSAKVALTGLSLDSAKQQVRFSLNRTGNQSVYGDLRVTFLPQSGAQEVLAEANGLAIYCPNPLRKVTMPLAARKPGSPLSGGRLRVTYNLPVTEGGALLAEGYLDLP